MEKVLKTKDAGALAELTLEYQQNHPDTRATIERRKDWMGRDSMTVTIEDAERALLGKIELVLMDELLDASAAFAMMVSDINGKEGEE